MVLTPENKSVREVSISPLARHLFRALTTKRVVRWLILGAVAAPALFAQDASPSLKLSPETIKMDTFYRGAKVRVEGVAPAGSHVLVVIRGEEQDEFFNRKGRVGPIWVNADRIHVTGAPSLFLSFSSADINSVADGATIQSLQLAEWAIKNQIACRRHCKCKTGMRQGGAAGDFTACQGVAPDPQYAELIRSSYLALKSREGSYQSHPAAVRIVESPQEARFTLDLDWPLKAPSGSYQVEMFAFRNRLLVARSSALLHVVEVGFPAQVAALSVLHPWLYGLMAVLAAVLAGFAIDALTVRLRRRAWRKPQATRPQPALPTPEPETPHDAHSGNSSVRENVHHY